MNYKLLRLCLLSLLVMLCGNVFADEVTLKYSGTTTANMTGDNDAALLSLDATAWSVVGDKGNNGNLPGLNKAGDLRLYWSDGGGNTITVTSLTGATINTIALTFTGDDYSNVSVTANGNAVTGADGVFTINASSFVLGNANTKNTQVRISSIVINYGASTSTLTTTTIQLGDKVTMGVIGDELALPSATVNAGEAAVAGTTVTWSSSDEKVAAIVDGKLKLKSAGTAKITADYAGDATYKASSTSFTVTSYEAYTTISEMMENISASKQYVQFQFKDLLVTGVMGSYTYVSDGSDEFLLYGQNLGMKAGDKVTGKASGQLYTYNNLPELSTSKANVEFTVASSDNQVTPTIIAPEELGVSLNKYITIKSATFVSASGKNLTFKVGDTEFIAYNQFNLGDDVISLLEADRAYDILGFGGCYKDTKQIFPMKFTEAQAASGWRDIKIDLTDGNLLNADEKVEWQQLPDVGVAVADDGTPTRVAADAANAAAVLTGKWHSNEHGWANFKATVKVEGPVKISMGTCAWGGDVKVTNAAGEVVGTFNTNTGACYHQDKAQNIVSINYAGEATTLTIEGGSYTPYFAVEALPKAEGKAIRVELLNSNLLSGDQVNNRNLKLGLIVDEDGTPSFTTDLDNKSVVAIMEGGDRQDDHGWINFKATVPVNGPVKITMGSCAWGGNVTVKNSEGQEVVPAFTTNTGACYHQDKEKNVVVAYYKGEATTLTIQGGSYVPYFAVEPVAEWQIPIAVKVSFALGESGADGMLPAEQTVEFGKKLTIPQNRTLYVDGKTLTSWTDGTNSYAPGDEAEFKEDTELKPVFTDNAVKFADRKAEVTAVWDFQQKNGAPVLSWQNVTGLYVTQVAVNGKVIDLKLDFDTNNGGKIANGSWNDWAQMNGGTKLTIPGFKGTAVSLEAYSDITTTTIGGKTGYETGKVITATTDEDPIEIVIGDGSYYRYVKAVYPAAAEGDNSFKGFAAIVNNQEGTLLTSAEQSQGTSINFGVTTADDGTTCRVAADDASAVATVSGQYHSDHGCTNLKVVVPGVTNVKITVGQCTYSTAEIKVTNEAGQVVASKTPSSPGCWKNDRNNVDVLYYTGDKATLTITGMSYCPFVAVAPLTEEELAQLNATYTLTYYDLDGSVIGTQEVKGQDPIGEFKYTADNVSMPVGVVFRGWFSTAEGGKKYKTDDKVEGAMSLYAVATPMEIADNKSTFAYNLADPNFDPADHECIEIADGGYYYNTHGWTFGPGQTMKLWVGGDATITIGGCAYSSGSDITIADAEGYAVGTVSGKNDSDGGLNTFEYKGAQTTLTLTFGGRDYIHSVAIANHSKAPEPADVIAHWSWQTGTPATIANVHVEGSTGTVASDVEGINLFVDATKGKLKSNGDNVQFNAGTIIQVPVISSNDVVTVVAHPYNFQEIKIGGKTFTTETTEYKASAVDAANGYVEIESTSSPYLYSITVVQKAPKQLATLDNEAVTATFVFNAGSEGQKADFGEAAGYFVTSKVTYGSNLFIKGIGAIGTGQTQFEPYEQQNEGASGTAADESNAIRFLIQPNFGLSFTPTKVSIKATRFGTDNGLLDFSWQNPDKTTVSLAVGVKPNRNNGSPNVSEYSYDITGATPGEGTCGLVVNLYHLQGVKQIGFSDIVIEGVLNGTEKEVPVLGTITINGTELTAEQVFDDAYEADFELSKQVAMVSAENPVSATAKKGDLGTITYEGDATQCKVSIPMTYGETTVSYVLNVVQKPDFTLTYISPEDGKTVLTTQQVEKDSPIGHFAGDAMSNYGIPEGYAMRGWYERSDGGRKYTVDDIVTGNMNLYGYCTEIETASLSKKYTFDLTDKLFDPDIHEAFNPTGDGFYWHDSQHGYAFKTGNKIDLLVGPKATVSVTLCRYGSAGDIVITDANGKEIGKIPGKNNTDTDGEIVAFNYEGEGGTITLNLDTDGEMYIHAVKIVNTSETNYESQGQWYFVKPGNAASFIDVLEVVNGINSNRDAERAYIFLPDGTYDLRQTVKTAISGHNISIIGQSMDGTIIVTAPDKSIEGLGSADMFQNSGSNLYLQDLTLKNALDYYQAGSAGRAAVIQDSGNRTIGKNVRLLSYQDTYFSSNNSQQAYWETCDFHGTVDFICGGGDIRFQNTTISLEPRALDGSGSRTIVAPTTNTAFGYVFDGCTVVDLAGGKGTWNFGRTWQNKPVTVYLNTTLDDNARNTIISTRWIEKGMNNTDPSLFGEYGTKNVNGNDITPAANSINSFGGTFQTIITADRAKDFSYEQMFSENLTKAWDPAALATQLKAPTDAKYDNGTVSWTKLRNGSIAFALFKNGEYVGMTDGETFNITIDPAVDALTIRAANPMGGFGPAAAVAGTVNRIADVKADDDSEAIYNLGGQRVSKAGKGVYIINGKKVIK